MNPYTNKVIIRNPANFYNRKTEVAKIFSRIGGPRPQSISIVGERRVGKSSLLYYICNESVRRKFLQDFEDYIFVFCDLEEKTDMDVDDFFTLVAKKIAIETRRFSEKDLFEKVTYDSFLKLIQELDISKKKVILAFDEFDVVTKNENFGSEFFSYLRSLANSYNVAYITSSRKDLQELCHTEGGIEYSPFFNIFTHMPIGPFDRESALELIREPSKREGIPLEEYSEFIFELAGFHPFFLQVACSNMFEYLDLHGSIDEEGFQNVEENFFEEAEDHFEYMWDHLEDGERRCLSTIAESEELMDRKLQFIAKKLVKRGFLTKDGRDYKIFSKPFKNFIFCAIEEEKHLG